MLYYILYIIYYILYIILYCIVFYYAIKQNIDYICIFVRVCIHLLVYLFIYLSICLHPSLLRPFLLQPRLYQVWSTITGFARPSRGFWNDPCGKPSATIPGRPSCLCWEMTWWSFSIDPGPTRSTVSTDLHRKGLYQETCVDYTGET